MKGTRVEVIRDIEAWVNDLSGAQLLWLAGQAGTGKSSIAWSICSLAKADAKIVLGGSFFFSRSTGEATQRDVRCVIPTLAVLLARQSSKLSKALDEELARDPDILHKQVATQVEQLLFKPLHALDNPPVPILFVIDALDECGDHPNANGAADNSESHRIVSEMLETLIAVTRYPVKLPVKFLVTSRPEAHIRDNPVWDKLSCMVMRLHALKKIQVTEDIRLYISTKLLAAPRLRVQFTDEHVDMLTRLSDGLFIVAATALKYTLFDGIDGAVERFETLLHDSRQKLSEGAAAPLDSMYALILDEAARVEESKTNKLSALLRMIAALISARMVLSVAALADILELPRWHLRARLSRLHAVIHVPEDDGEPGLCTLHASFGDYLLGRAARHLRISSTLGHEVLAHACILRMKQKDLCFNISRSRSSFEPNPATSPDWLSLPLIYACLHWAHHIYSASKRAA